MARGYTFAWMRTNAGEDPPVWVWVEGDGPPTEPKWSSWLDWLLAMEQWENESRQRWA